MKFIGRTPQECYASFMYKYARGKFHVSTLTDPIDVPAKALVINEFLLKEVEWLPSIPTEWFIYMIPTFIFGWFVIGYLDQHVVKTVQAHNDYGPRHVTPWTMELIDNSQETRLCVERLEERL